MVLCTAYTPDSEGTICQPPVILQTVKFSERNHGAVLGFQFTNAVNRLKNREFICKKARN